MQVTFEESGMPLDQTFVAPASGGEFLIHRPIESGDVFLLPPGLTRWEFADTRANALPKLDMGAVINEVNKRLNGSLLGLRATKVGVIARDPDAVYEVALFDDGGKQAASIGASTVVHRLQVTISAGDSLTDSSTLSALLSLVQRATRAAVADNPD
jgi:hypothetical protein